MNKRVLIHIAFWLLVVTVLTIFYGTGLPDYGIGFNIIMMLIPVHIGYFYTVAYGILPRFLYRGKYIKLLLSVLGCTLFFAAAYRIIEICFADPYLYHILIKENPAFKWKKLNGTFWQQFTNPIYIVNALEQSNFVFLVAISLKFIKMWIEKRQLTVQAELSALKSQIHPHFLFNTLNNLYALTLQQSPQSPAIVLGLSDILRYMLYECSTDNVLLRRDIEIMQHYVALERLRYEDRLDLNFSIAGDVNMQRIPPLLMLPLIENAFKHGTSEAIDEVWINIDLFLKKNKLKFKISNSKPPEETGKLKKSAGQIGLNNVKKRLELLFPSAHQLQVFNTEDMFVVILDIDLKQNLVPHENKNLDRG
ncbi:MAG: histidine kinase [Chitinophaga sp.]|uniref:sensor histidine kinase n=1 Tax=Chitinophaga sp. TaxID=1869181 RepID=UPI001AFF43CD|nr:histidine kinase [Chitinophaga sp.]MBO9729238.1 histidine kinase [Chitinophaga sp.]